MYEEEKYGITFSVDARVEFLFGILSKFKKEDYEDLFKTFEDFYPEIISTLQNELRVKKIS